MLGINIIETSKIHPSLLNSRKVFDQNYLKELAQSISEQGVIEPIMVRPSEDDMFEIVCGECRYRSSIIAGMTTIPAMIRTLTDDEAIDIMITENLQRRDVSPMEEATAFLQLIERRRATIPELAARFGKSEIYIRNRIRLNELIPEFQKLIEHDLIPVTHGLELCKLDTRIQQDLCNSHYKANQYDTWNNITSKELVRRINNISQSFEDASFDLTDCQTCQFNSLYSDLFSDGDKCTNKFCFGTKQIKALTDKAIRINNEGGKCIFYRWSYGGNTALSESITAAGITVFDASFYEIESAPEYPERYNNEADENYSKRLENYQKRLDKYERLSELGYAPGICVYSDRLDIGHYVKQKQKDLNFAGSHQEAIKELQKQREKEFDRELINIFDDLKNVFNIYPIPEKQKLTKTQNDLLCYAMLKRIGENEYKKILPNLNLERAEKQGRVLAVIAPINERQRYQITILFMKHSFSNFGLYNQMWRRPEAEAFVQLAETVHPDKLKEIKNIRAVKRKKRVSKIDDQINSLKE